jgi:prepilin peptidase CpaA
MVLQGVSIGVLAVLLAAAVRSDLRTRRIPNRVALAILLCGLAAALLRVPAIAAIAGDGGPSLVGALAGMAAGLALTFPLYLVRALGAGDVKLFAAVGAWVGPWQVVGVILLAGIAGGLLAAAYTLWLRYRGSVFGNLRLTLFALLSGGGRASVRTDVVRAGTKLPYAAAIAAGTALQLLLVLQGGWVFA